MLPFGGMIYSRMLLFGSIIALYISRLMGKEVVDVADMGTKEASEKWGYTQATIRTWCKKGLIIGATQDFPGSTWHIPLNAKCPRPEKSGKAS